MLRRGLVYAVVVTCSLAAAPAALGAWAAQKMAVPQAATGQFNSVSCVTGQCIAVGGAINSAGQGISLAQKHTSGTTWSAMTVANPSGDFATELDSVSCTATTSCVALGYSEASTTGNISQTWNGTSWSSPAFLPNASSGASPDLSQISCWAAGSCVAVGDIPASSGTVSQVPSVAVRSGSTWKVYALSNPVSGAEADYLTGVSCPASASGKCMAVGYAQTYSGYVPFAELLTTSSGALSSNTKEAIAAPSAYSGYAFLYSVSCTSISACVAVGFGDGVSGSGNYATTWTTTWSTPVLVATTSGNELTSISCTTSTTACVAVGYEEANQLSGTTWSKLSPPLDVFAGVSCTSSTSCMAVGSKPQAGGAVAAGARKPPVAPATRLATERKAQTKLQTTLAQPTSKRSAASQALRGVAASTAPAGHTAAASWAGGTASTAWTAQTTISPSGAQTSSVDRISCAGGKCLAVGGESVNYYAFAPLAESGPGTWTIQSKVGAITGDQTYLSDVSCFGATQCMVLGQNETTNAPFSQLATAGSPWSAGTPVNFAVPTSSFAGGLYINRISCKSATACTADGYDINSNTSADDPLIESWNGTKWTAEATPGASGLDNVEMEGVSCATSTACSAVGAVMGSANSKAFAESWAGTTWSMQTMTFPSGAAGSQLLDVSCPVAGTCTAVGWWNNSSGTTPLAERLASGKWAPQTLNSTTQSDGTQAVSCADSSDCIAVGSGTAEAWASSVWGAPATLPMPAGYYYSPDMYGVYCSAATSCTAAGYAQSYVVVPLAETYS